jgi:hypothetical protein
MANLSFPIEEVLLVHQPPYFCHFNYPSIKLLTLEEASMLFMSMAPWSLYLFFLGVRRPIDSTSFTLFYVWDDRVLNLQVVTNGIKKLHILIVNLLIIQF